MTAIDVRVRKVADVVRRLSREEMAQLIELVPELREIKPASERREEANAVEYFRQLALEMSGGVTPSLQDEFLEGLTYEEYFALPDEEEKALWDRIFAEDATGPYDLKEHEASTDAVIAARQERGT
ncbi:MAG: hypothetical protein ACETWR_03955 [Anaerolineae bacterium]